jgi:hypothetical protein
MIFFNPFKFFKGGAKEDPKPTPTHEDTFENSSQMLQYPANIQAFQARPIVQFTAYVRDGKKVTMHNVFFPCPGNIQINDGASYNSIDLGMSASTLEKSQSEIRTNGLGGLAAASLAPLKTAMNLKGSEVAALAREIIPDATKVGEAAKLLTRQVTNPNTNTTFERNAVRTFDFNFKMIAKTEQETKAINKIHKLFRKYIYADTLKDGQNIVLNYPPIWTIKFLTADGIENHFIPKIYSCYLTSFNTVFNGENNMYFRDNAPFEVDVSMSYQETRSLTRGDIKSLEGNTDTFRGLDTDGIPTLTTPRTGG